MKPRIGYEMAVFQLSIDFLPRSKMHRNRTDVTNFTVEDIKPGL